MDRVIEKEKRFEGTRFDNVFCVILVVVNAGYTIKMFYTNFGLFESLFAVIPVIMANVINLIDIEVLVTWEMVLANFVYKIILFYLTSNWRYIEKTIDNQQQERIVMWGIFIGYVLTIAISVPIQLTKRQNKENNRILYLEKKLPAINSIPVTNLSDIMDDAREYIDVAGDYDSVFENNILGEKDLSAEKKKELLNLIRSSKETVYLDNEMRYFYLNTLEKVIRLSKGGGKANLEECVLKMPFDPRTYDINFRKDTNLSVVLKKRIQDEVYVPLLRFEPYRNAANEWYEEFQKEYNIIKTGYEGERKVEAEIGQYEFQFNALTNIRLEVRGNSIENDLIVVSRYGVYVIEIKNYGSTGKYGLHIDKDGRWNKVIGNKREPVSSPIEQNERHALYLEEFLNKNLKRNMDTSEYIKVKNIVVIANDEVDIENESDNTVIRYNNLTNFIRKADIYMSQEDVDSITEIIYKNALQTKKYPIRNFYYKSGDLLYQGWKEWIYTRELYRTYERKTKEIRDYVLEYKTTVKYNCK